MASKCSDETLRMRGMNVSVHFAHARRHIFACRGPDSSVRTQRKKTTESVRAFDIFLLIACTGVIISTISIF